MTCIYVKEVMVRYRPADGSIVARPMWTQSAVNGLLCRIMCLSETHFSIVR